MRDDGHLERKDLPARREMTRASYLWQELIKDLRYIKIAARSPTLSLASSNGISFEAHVLALIRHGYEPSSEG